MAELSRARLCSLYLTAMEARPAPDLTPHLRTAHPTALSVFHAGAGQGTQRRGLGGGLRAAGTGHLSRALLSPRATPPPPPPASHGTRSTPATATLLASAGAAGARAVGVGGAHRRAPAHPPRQAAGAAEPRARPRAPTLRRGVSLVSTNLKLDTSTALRPPRRQDAKNGPKAPQRARSPPLSISHDTTQGKKVTGSRAPPAIVVTASSSSRAT